jgi:N-acetyl-anhydromuramyl-L-alanine amidase AmpD
MINIIKKQCTNWSERDGFRPEIIVIHISAGSLTSMDNWFATPGSQASAHYGVSLDGTKVCQYVDESKMAWANGRVNNPSFVLYKPNINPNKYTISIENEGQDLAKAPESQLTTLVALIKEIAARWNIPMDRNHIIGHFQVDAVNRPYCPSPNHSIIDKIVARIEPEELVCVKVPKSKLSFITSLFKIFKL